MKAIFCLVLFSLLIPFYSCEKISENAVKLSVDFTWEGMESCDWGNPEINIRKIPEQTKHIKIHMYDHKYKYDHGSVVFEYTGENIIPMDRYKNIQGPCPPYEPGEYEITIKALDKNKIVIGMGSKTRFFPEK